MRRAALAGLVLALTLLLAAPAGAALTPPPTVVTFDDLAVGTEMQFVSPQGVRFNDNDNCADVNPDPRARSAPNVLGGPYPDGFTCSPMKATFSTPQAYVGLFVSHTQNPGAQPQGQATLIAYRTCPPGIFDPSDPVATAVVSESSSALSPLAISDPAGTIGCITLAVSQGYYVVDDLSFSPSLQPDTEITAGPAASTIDATAALAFRANQTASFQCAADAGPFEPCASPRQLGGLGLGPHGFQVRAVDVYGVVDPTPAAYGWTIVPAPPPDTDGDGVPDGTDNCVTAANADQADVDGDTIGNACELLPNGNVPAVAGSNVIAKDVRGEVFVKLPRARSARGLLADPGFVPLKGVASLPVGAVVDARKGSLALQSAANSRPAADRRRRTQQARLAAGIFRIRQQRLKRRLSREIPTDLQLVSGATAERACANSTRRRPRKSIVRSLTLSGRGFYRALGGASIGTSQNGTWITTDRCDGTLTEVGRGKVRVRDPRRNKTTTVRAGRGFLVKKPLFLPLKGRPAS